MPGASSGISNHASPWHHPVHLSNLMALQESPQSKNMFSSVIQRLERVYTVSILSLLQKCPYPGRACIAQLVLCAARTSCDCSASHSNPRVTARKAAAMRSQPPPMTLRTLRCARACQGFFGCRSPEGGRCSADLQRTTGLVLFCMHAGSSSLTHLLLVVCSEGSNIACCSTGARVHASFQEEEGGGTPGEAGPSGAGEGAAAKAGRKEGPIRDDQYDYDVRIPSLPSLP